MIASGQAREAISKCVSVLAQLGELVPEHVNNNVYAEEVQQVKRSLMGLSEDDLLVLPLMTDVRKSVRVTFEFVLNALNFKCSRCSHQFISSVLFRHVYSL